MRKLAFLLFFTSPIYAAQSINFTTAQAAQITLSGAPWNAVGSTRFEFKVSSMVIPGNYSFVFDTTNSSSFHCRIISSTAVICNDVIDGNQQTGLYLYISTGEYLVRVQRDIVNNVLTEEMWNGDGTGYQRSQVAITPQPVAGDFSGVFDIGFNTQAIGQVGYLHWFSTLVPIGSVPPTQNTPGDLGSWDFEGNLNDSSVHFSTLTLTSGSASYVTSANYGPIAFIGTDTTSIVSSLFQNNSTSITGIDGNTSLTYNWSLHAKPAGSASTLSNTTIQNPTITPDTWGEYDIWLYVTNSNGIISSTASFALGAVCANATTGVINWSCPGLTNGTSIQFILGDQQMWGRSPWPYMDYVQKFDVDYLISNFPIPTTPIMTLSTHTISCVQGNAFCTCDQGTGCQSDFACANQDDQFVSTETRSDGGGSGVYEKAYQIGGCSGNNILIQGDHFAGQTMNHLGYSIILNANVGYWTSGTENYNYYDRVQGYYNLCYRSGLTKYCTEADTEGTNWWVNPFLNRGDSTGYPPRSVAMLNEFTRAVRQNNSQLWNDIAFHVYQSTTGSWANMCCGVQDLREQGYIADWAAMDGFLDPISTQAAASLLGAEYFYNNEFANWNTSGSIWGEQFGQSTLNSNGTVNVLNSSSSITGNSTTFTSLPLSGGCTATILIVGQPVGYFVTQNNDTSLTTIDTVNPSTGFGPPTTYQGLTANSTSYVFQIGVTGYSISPWRIFAMTKTLIDLHKNTGNPIYLNLLESIVNWQISNGYSSRCLGPRYEQAAYECQAYPETETACPPCLQATCDLTNTDTTGGKEASRYDTPELLNAIGYVYSQTRNPTYSNFASILIGSDLGEYGGPNPPPVGDTFWGQYLEPAFHPVKDFALLTGAANAYSVLGALAETTPNIIGPDVSINGHVNITGNVLMQ